MTAAAVSAALANLEIFTAREVAAVLKVHPSKIYRLIQAGKLPAIHIGRNVRVSRPALEAYLAKAQPAAD